MNLLQKLGLYGLTIAGLSGLLYNKANLETIENNSKHKLENIVNNNQQIEYWPIRCRVVDRNTFRPIENARVSLNSPYVSTEWDTYYTDENGLVETEVPIIPEYGVTESDIRGDHIIVEAGADGYKLFKSFFYHERLLNWIKPGEVINDIEIENNIYSYGSDETLGIKIRLIKELKELRHY